MMNADDERIRRFISKVRMPPGTMKTVYSWLTSLLFALLPSFVQRWLRPHEFQPRKLTPTSWLDGLRGVAALFVYINHYTGMNYSKLQRAYGDHELVPWSSPVQLPFIRVVFCGFPMVHIFFVISGLVLSYKPIRLLREQQYEELYKTLSSSVFRRGFRLFLPTMGSTIFVMVCRYYGLLSGQLPSLAEHLWNWYAAFWKITDFWSWDVLWYPPYDVHLWTIAIEFSHSMLLFLVVIGTSRLRPFLRMAFSVAFITYCLKCGHWGPAEFIAGMMIAELIVMENAESSKNDLDYVNREYRDDEADELLPPESRATSLKKTGKSLGRIAFFTINLLFGLFVAGWPNGDVTTMPGFSTLYNNTMNPFWTTGGNMLIFPWYALGAVQIVMAVHQIPTLQKVFTSSVGQYLGDISFSLYLMHGPLQGVLEWRVIPGVWRFFVDPEAESYGMASYTMAWACGLLILAPMTIWISDIFWRFVDVQSVHFARWLERKCIVN